MSFGFLVATFLATTNAGRVALAAQTARPGRRDWAIAVLAAVALVLLGVLLADPLLDALSISPPSFRLAAGIVLLAAGLKTLVWPTPAPGPFAAVLVTPELTVAVISFGADEPAGKVLAAAALGLLPILLAARARRAETSAAAARLLAALQIVAGVALGVNGIRDV
jgi:small neutral amino acid transporter SnatA (MarC family)